MMKLFNVGQRLVELREEEHNERREDVMEYHNANLIVLFLSLSSKSLNNVQDWLYIWWDEE